MSEQLLSNLSFLAGTTNFQEQEKKPAMMPVSVLTGGGASGVETIEVPLEVACALIILKCRDGTFNKINDPVTFDDITLAQSTVTTFRELSASTNSDSNSPLSGGRGAFDVATPTLPMQPLSANGGGRPSLLGGDDLLQLPQFRTAPQMMRSLDGIHIDPLKILKDARYAVAVQDMLNAATPSQLKSMLSQIRTCALTLTLNSHGCRVVQKILEVGTLEDRLFLVHPVISNKIIECAMDVNGNHVVQKIIDSLPSAELQFMSDALAAPAYSGDGLLGAPPGVEVDPSATSNARRLASHCYGCRVIQRLLAHCDTAQKEAVLEALCGDPATIASMTVDVFGNYVVQHALEFGRDVDKERVALCIASLDLCAMSCSKFASNVVEKAIRVHNVPNPSSNAIIVTKLLINAMLIGPSTDGSNAPPVLHMMRDRYGNYVVRAVVELQADVFQQEVEVVKQIVLENAASLKKYTYGWHLVEKIEKMGGPMLTAMGAGGLGGTRPQRGSFLDYSPGQMMSMMQQPQQQQNGASW